VLSWLEKIATKVRVQKDVEKKPNRKLQDKYGGKPGEKQDWYSEG